MKKTYIGLLFGTFALCPLTAIAQGPGRPDGPPPPPHGMGRQGAGHRPVPPIIKALDINGDGVIDADEIAKASESLKKLDKNHDGKLAREELMPPRPRGEEGREMAPRGEGGRGPEGRGPRGRGHEGPGGPERPEGPPPPPRGAEGPDGGFGAPPPPPPSDLEDQDAGE